MAYLLVREEEEAQRVELSGEDVTFGRASDNTVVLVSKSVSSHHCRIVSKDTGFTLEDQGSTNGTRINGKEISTRILVPGDMIAVGDVEVMFADESQQQENPFVGPTGTIRRAPVDSSPFSVRKDSKMVWIVLLSVVGVLVIGTIVFFLRSLI